MLYNPDGKIERLSGQLYELAPVLNSQVPTVSYSNVMSQAPAYAPHHKLFLRS